MFLTGKEGFVGINDLALQVDNKSFAPGQEQFAFNAKHIVYFISRIAQ